MTWLTPALAGIAAAIAIPSLIILYFLKLRRREMEVSTTLLWKKAIQDLQANAPFQKLRRNILLLLQLLVLGAALFAVAQPQLKGQTVTGERHIILIDRSASMASDDGDEAHATTNRASRLDAAKKRAKDLVDSFRDPAMFLKESGDQAMVIAFDTIAEVRQQFTGDKGLLKAAIDSITPTDAPTRIDEAMRLAKAHAPQRQLQTSPSGENLEVEGLDLGSGVTMHLFSDGKIPDAGATKPGKADTFLFERVGEPEAGNIGITGLRAERAFDEPTKLSIFVGMESTLRMPRKVDVELAIDGATAGIKSVTMPGAAVTTEAGAATSPPSAESTSAGAAGGAPAPAAPLVKVTPATGGVVFTLERIEGGLARVRFTGLESEPGALASQRDVLDGDNRAWLVIPPAKRLSVALVTTGNLFLANALDALPLSKRDRFTPKEFEKALRDGKAGQFDVVVLDGWVPGDGTTGDKSKGLPPGRYLVLNGVPTQSGLLDRGRGPASVIIDWNRQHPVTRLLNLDSLTIAASRLVEVVPRSVSDKPEDQAKAADLGAGAATVLAQCDQGPAIVETGGRDWRAIVVPFDAAESTWPFDVSFLVFMASAVDYLGGNGSQATPAQLVQPGSVLTDRLPIGAGDAEVKSPDGKTEPLIVAADGKIAFGPVRTHGVYEVSWKGPTGLTDVEQGGRVRRMFAANLLDADESDVSAADTLGLSSRVVAAHTGADAKAARKLWPYFLLGALAVVMLEWFIYNRKVHV